MALHQPDDQFTGSFNNPAGNVDERKPNRFHPPGCPGTSQAPLDNNICEQTLKKAILHRKNSLFYKTEHGAFIGDMFMSLIHTCNLGGVNPFDYLVALQKNSAAVFKNPGNWMPWNYQSCLPVNDS